MIEHGQGWVVRHASGRYLHSDIYSPGFEAGLPRRDWPPTVYIYQLLSHPFHAVFIHDRSHCERFLETPAWAPVADQFDIVPGPGCRCCGTRMGTMWGNDGHWRCDKHRFRNPCAVEGCRRTKSRSKDVAFSEDDHLCGEHWRMFCPPGSRMRRIYNRLWRLRKKRGKWTPDLERRYWIAWRRIVSNARSGSAGDIDMNEINKMFGWE